MNKYNVRAIRKELDDCVRNHAWNKFCSKVTGLLDSNEELLQAVVLAKSKRTSGSLLHVLVGHDHTSHPKVRSLITSICKAVPQALYVQDAQLQTPLHIAIDRGQCVEMVIIMLEISSATNAKLERREEEGQQPHQTVNNILAMTDRQGDTPLLKASRLDVSQYINVLLRYDKHRHSTVLIEGKRKQRTALWYVAATELQNTAKTTQYVIPEDLRHVLLATYFAFQRQQGNAVDEDEWNTFWLELSNAATKQGSITIQYASCLSLTIRALITCGHVLGKYAVKMLDYIQASDFYCDFMVPSQEIDKDGNTAIHHVCMCDVAQSPESHIFSTPRTQGPAINALLLEMLMRQDGSDLALSHPNRWGDMPLHLAVASQKGNIPDLIAAFPDALQHTNHQGELPLHIALKMKANGFVTSGEFLQTLDRLWKAEPGTVGCRDGPTKLFPFQLAASGEWGPWLDGRRSNNQDHIDEVQPVAGFHVDTSNTQWLTLVFTLLLASPQVIK